MCSHSEPPCPNKTQTNHIDEQPACVHSWSYDILLLIIPHGHPGWPQAGTRGLSQHHLPHLLRHSCLASLFHHLFSTCHSCPRSQSKPMTAASQVSTQPPTLHLPWDNSMTPPGSRVQRPPFLRGPHPMSSLPSRLSPQPLSCICTAQWPHLSPPLSAGRA